MGKITFILGGARSGKSSYAMELARRCTGKVAFIATCRPLDNEMKKRIRLHKQSRPDHWKTFEEPTDLAPLLKKTGAKFDMIVIDCLTLLVCNLLMARYKEAAVRNQFKKILNILARTKAEAIIVSNEVGLGIVPDSELGREFRDIAGRINQIAAAKADSIFFLISGIPWKIK